MFSKQIEFEWHTGEGDFSAIPPAFGGQAQSEAVSRQNDAFRAVNRAVVIICILLISAFALATSNNTPLDELNIARAVAGVERSLVLETEAWETRDHKLFMRTFDPATDYEWRRQLNLRWDTESSVESTPPLVRVHDVAQHDGMALVTLLVTDGGNLAATPHRQYRFYREVAGEWLQTLPTDAFWGDSRLLETPHLRFRYHDREAKVVGAVAADLELTLQTFYATVGESLPTAEKKVTLELIPRALYGWAYAGDRLMVSSPYMLSIPAGGGDAESGDADAFASSIISRFGFRVLDQVRRQGKEPWRTLWDATHPGVHSWLMVTVAQKPQPWNAKADAIFAEHVRKQGPLQLKELRAVTDQIRFPYEWYLRTKLAESVVAYADHTYGRDKIPAMLHALANVRSWEDLTRGVYEVSVEEFEAGWNEYVETRY